MNKTIKIIITSVFACVGLLSCDNVSHVTGKDGYYFEKESMTRNSMQLNIVLVQSQKELESKLSAVGGSVESGREVAAFSVYSETTPLCTIYMIDPKVSYQPEWYGHELVHCIYGKWHVKQP